MNSPNSKQQMTNYLKQLVVGIETGHKVAGVTFQMVSESDLERFVRVGSAGDDTLLRTLGYDTTTVDDHSGQIVQMGTKQYVPDYVLHYQKQRLAVLELKRPDAKLDNKDWTWEVLSYCQQLGAPLGLLFNGSALRVFINTQHRQLSKHIYKDLFSDEPVATADCSDIVKMVDLLCKFSAEALQANAVKLARELANKRIKGIGGEKRKTVIRAILAQALVSSPAGDIDQILEALATVSSLWTELDPKPDGNELAKAWQSMPAPSNPQPAVGSRKGINPALRAKVAEVCGRKGWNVVANANIEGLRYRLDGNKLNGYHSVTQGPGVPDGLCVQGVSTPVAESIMVELKKL